MSRKSLKIQVEIPEWNSSIDSSILLNTMKENVFKQLEEQNRSAKETIVLSSCKNALSLARSRKNKPTKLLTVYLPENCINNVNSCLHSMQCVSTGSKENSEEQNMVDETDDASVYPKISFEFTDEKGLVINTNFVSLKNIFSSFLSNSSKSIDLSFFINEICEYCFNSDTKLFVNLAGTRRELCSQLSCLIRDAKKKAKAKNTTAIKILIELEHFIFHVKSVENVHKSDEFSSIKFDSFVSHSSSSCILLTRGKDQICIQPGKRCFKLHISKSFASRALQQLDITNTVNIEELCFIIERYSEKRKLKLNIESSIDNIKACILNERIEKNQVKFFTCSIELDNQKSLRENADSIDLDTILGPVYSTRGVKRTSSTVTLNSDISDSEVDESEQDESWQSKSSSTKKKSKTFNSKREELLRRFLHIKDEYHITDAAVKALHKFFKETKEPFYSMSEIDRVRKRSNKHIPIKYAKDSAYVPFEFALRAAIFVAIKYRPDLLKLNQLSFRLNMDGTLMGNKHVVAISVNCVDGGPFCQTAKRLVPVGIFEIQKESNELLRQTLPPDFLEDIQSVKQLQVNKRKCVTVKIRLGGDYQNAIYVFGLAGVHSNYPCVFCTQHKSYLHVTERNTEYEEEIFIGSGKKRKKEKQKVIVNPTSVYDKTLGARTLEEKTECLNKKINNRSNNELGYQSEPLFGDLFEFSDYVLDTLHMRLRIFDIILKDILSEASRTGEYEPNHSKKLQEKINILNKHASETIGKRFFFKLEAENNIKTIVSCGRFSGHLQNQFFADSFPYDKIIQNEDLSKKTKELVQKFKFILELVKTEKSKRVSDLAEVAKSFVKDFRSSGLRTGCTPYMHLIGVHLAEQDKYEDLRAYDTQGVEKSNDLLSRLYFSSSNRAKNPLKTMVQSLYRRLEMTFDNHKDRYAMNRYSLRMTWDESDNDEDTNSEDSISRRSVDFNQSGQLSCDDSYSNNELDEDTNKEDSNENLGEEDESDIVEGPIYVTQNSFSLNRSKTQWKSFRKN